MQFTLDLDKNPRYFQLKVQFDDHDSLIFINTLINDPGLKSIVLRDLTLSDK